MTEFLTYIAIINTSFPEKRPKVYIIFILKIIKAIILKVDNDPTTQQYVKCLKLFYNIIPEPYVPRDDVKDLLQFLLKDSDRKEEIIEKYLTTYVELFDMESTESYTPRSLKHLSCCVQRNSIIRSSKTLTMCVNDMCLPEEVKELLLGEPNK